MSDVESKLTPARDPDLDRATARAIPLIHPTLVHPTAALAATIPEEMARRLRVLPVLVSGGTTLWLAMEDPGDEAALAECSAASKMRARAMAATGSELRASFHRWYGGSPPRPSLPPKPPTRRRVSVLELDVAPPSIPAPVLAPPAVVLVVQGLPALAESCLLAFVRENVVVQEADLVTAARVAREVSPFAIVLPDEVFSFDPFAFEALALSTRALLITVRDAEASHLRPLLATAHRRLYG